VGGGNGKGWTVKGLGDVNERKRAVERGKEMNHVSKEKEPACGRGNTRKPITGKRVSRRRLYVDNRGKWKKVASTGWDTKFHSCPSQKENIRGGGKRKGGGMKAKRRKGGGKRKGMCGVLGGVWGGRRESFGGKARIGPISNVTNGLSLLRDKEKEALGEPSWTANRRT